MGEQVKWTPGPWVVDDYREDTPPRWFVVPATYRGTICSIRADGEADAHLIAAAPDLYDALEWCVRALEQDYRGSAEDCEIPQDVRAVLSKARGEA